MALLYGDLRFITVTDQEMVYRRSYFDDFAVVVFNKSKESAVIEFHDPLLVDREVQAVFGNEINHRGTNLSVKLSSLSFEIIIPK